MAGMRTQDLLELLTSRRSPLSADTRDRIVDVLETVIACMRQVPSAIERKIPTKVELEIERMPQAPRGLDRGTAIAMGLGAGLVLALVGLVALQRRRQQSDQLAAALRTREAGAHYPMTQADLALAEQVRAKIAHCSDHPRNIVVHVHGRIVTLSGPIHESEVQPLIACASDVKGVQRIVNNLDVIESSQTPHAWS